MAEALAEKRRWQSIGGGSVIALSGGLPQQNVPGAFFSPSADYVAQRIATALTDEELGQPTDYPARVEAAQLMSLRPYLGSPAVVSDPRRERALLDLSDARSALRPRPFRKDEVPAHIAVVGIGSVHRAARHFLLTLPHVLPRREMLRGGAGQTFLFALDKLEKITSETPALKGYVPVVEIMNRLAVIEPKHPIKDETNARKLLDELHAAAEVLNSYAVSVDPEVFRKIPRKIGVAGSRYKLRQIMYAIEAGYIDHLVVDIHTALCLKKMAKAKDQNT
jgi:hypothetical protein